MEIGGYDIKGAPSNLYFSLTEERYAKQFRKKNKGKFIIMWVLAGSAFHKVYPYAEYVAKNIMERHKDVMIVTVGDEMSQLLEWEHPRTKNMAAKWSIRKTMLMTKHVDLVIGPETGVLNAASCFDTPKIVFLSHSSEENLTKYWTNTQVLKPNVECHPCHRLIFTLDACPCEPFIKAPLCTTKIPWKLVVEKIDSVYDKWRQKWVRSTSATGYSMKRTESCTVV
jgi:ADP-heptose:LPS heptosyltransferase